MKKNAMRAVRRCAAVLLIWCLLIVAGCQGGNSARERLQGEGAEAESTAETATNHSRTPDPNFDPSAVLIGLVMDESEGALAKAAEHGFLRTAENLGYPAKLYVAESSEKAAEMVDTAISDGCEGLLIWADTEPMKAAMAKARAAGIITIATYHSVEEGEADANLKVEPMDYAPEAARILCERIKTRDVEKGTIFVTGAEQFPLIMQPFRDKVKSDYPQFDVVAYEGKNDQNSVNAFVLAHPEMVGVLALEQGSGLIWNDACNQVQDAILEARKTPKPTAESEGDNDRDDKETPKPTPTPTPDESYKRYANILLLDYTPENLRLVRRGVVTGLIGRPFYDSTAQSVAVLDRLLRGLPTQTDVVLNTPILRKKDIAKYEGIMGEVVEWFAITPTPTGTPTPKPTVIITPKPTKKPSPSASSSSSPAASASKSPKPKPSASPKTSEDE